jgi:hypothetical protein
MRNLATNIRFFERDLRQLYPFCATKLIERFEKNPRSVADYIDEDAAGDPESPKRVLCERMRRAVGL